MRDGTPRRWSDDENERLVQMLGRGSSRAEIAIALGRSIDAVSRRKTQLLREGKISARPRRTVEKSRRRLGWSILEETILRDAVDSGMSLSEIVELVGRSESAVTARAFRMGLAVHV